MTLSEIRLMVRSNFFFGILFMPGAKREAVKNIYGFCRATDDAADLDPDRGKAALEKWREELVSCFGGRPRHPVMRALAPHIATHGLKREYFEKLLEGFSMDLERRRYGTVAEMETYLDCVAGAPGLLVLQVLGVEEDAKARAYSENLSRGLQVVNIIRDLGADAAQDRVYLPREDFEMFGYTEDALKAGEASEAFFKLARFEVVRARGYFRKAQMALNPALRRRLLGPEIMRETYESLLKKMERVLDLALDRRAPGVSLAERLVIAIMTWAEGRVTG